MGRFKVGSCARFRGKEYLVLLTKKENGRVKALVQQQVKSPRTGYKIVKGKKEWIPQSKLRSIKC